MKGLAVIPDISSLTNVYERLHRQELIEIHDWVLWIQWVRFDPRLGEMLAEVLVREWKNISPIKLNFQLKTAPWPQCFGVLIEQVICYYLMDLQTKKLFRAWGKLVMSGIKPRNGELFFIGTRSIDSDRLQKLVARSTNPYRKWGFFEDEVWKNKWNELQGRQTTWSQEQRSELMKRLSKEKIRVRPKDLVQASEGQISLRVAQMDLKNSLKQK